MSVTAKGRRWEILHSLWVGWTFTLGFFNWIAFFYVGLRAKQRKWILWGLLYSTPFIVEMFVLDSETRDSTLGNLTIALQLILAVVSIIHAFKIRKEYLLRLEALQRARKAMDREATLKRRIEAEYGVSAQKRATTQNAVPTRPVNSPGLSSGRERPQTRSKETTASPMVPITSTPSPIVVDNVTSAVPLPQSRSGEELDYRIASSYPFPIAFGFRSLMSIVDVRDLYREQLRIAENMLAFLASISLALLKEEDREKADVDPKEYWLTGISPGDWRDIIARCSKVFASYDDNPTALAIKGLNIRSEKKGFGADVAALIRAKNDFKHDRGPVVLEDIAEASREVQEKLKRCMEALAFSTSHPIR